MIFTDLSHPPNPVSRVSTSILVVKVPAPCKMKKKKKSNTKMGQCNFLSSTSNKTGVSEAVLHQWSRQICCPSACALGVRNDCLTQRDPRTPGSERLLTHLTHTHTYPHPVAFKPEAVLQICKCYVSHFLKMGTDISNSISHVISNL